MSFFDGMTCKGTSSTQDERRDSAGYQVCEKWLKDRKGRTLSYDDTTHYSKVVAALTRTRALMREIDAVADGALWPKAH